MLHLNCVYIQSAIRIRLIKLTYLLNQSIIEINILLVFIYVLTIIFYEIWCKSLREKGWSRINRLFLDIFTFLLILVLSAVIQICCWIYLIQMFLFFVRIRNLNLILIIFIIILQSIIVSRVFVVKIFHILIDICKILNF